MQSSLKFSPIIVQKMKNENFEFWICFDVKKIKILVF